MDRLIYTALSGMQASMNQQRVIASKINRYGRFFVIIGRGTFSAAQNLCTSIAGHSACPALPSVIARYCTSPFRRKSSSASGRRLSAIAV